LHYLAGVLELADGDRARAIDSWRRSLALSDEYARTIVERGRGVLTDEELLDGILPDRPQTIVAAAAQLYPDAGAAGRRPFSEKALRLLSQPGAARSATDLHLEATLHESLDDLGQAAAAYEAALDRAPQEIEWRYEFARLLHRQGRLKEARRQLLTVLTDQPSHREGQRLLQVVAREMAEKE
jgi:thioredoxin-like negative regulator of GroEL